jgi:polyribonucleotide nucleotidyltransferase
MPRRKELSQKQRDFFYFYTNPTSETYDNATQSAIKAGYKESYAKAEVYKKLVPVVTKHNKKLVEAEDEANARRIRILNQAEANLEEYVSLDAKDTTDKKIKADITKFASERLGKDHYSTRSESVNSSIQLLTVDAREALEAQLRQYLPTTTRIHEHVNDDVAN